MTENQEGRRFDAGDVGKAVIMWQSEKRWHGDLIRRISEDGLLVCLHDPRPWWKRKYQERWYESKHVRFVAMPGAEAQP